jgi:hypothetical protein
MLWNGKLCAGAVVSSKWFTVPANVMPNILSSSGEVEEHAYY